MTIADVRSERSRLQLKLRTIEDDLRDNYSSLKISLKPANLIKSLFESPGDATPGVVSDKMSMIGGSFLNLLISGILMKKSGIIKRLVASSVIQKIAPFLIKQGIPALSGLISKLKEKSAQKYHGSRHYDRTTAYDFNSK